MIASIAGWFILVGAVMDYQFYRSVIVRQDLHDLSIKMLLDARQQGKPAVRLKPDFTLARNNLRYSQERKRLKEGKSGLIK